ncbi:MAG: hypothetical protein BWY19_00268 [bacterium ADurb.Bin212]|nr:MAG: hypothetical protein BWY19_00268 [bacterium ADurb.Bin212]
MNKKIIIPAVVLSVAAIAGTIYATGASASFGRGQEMTSQLAEKLGIEESSVENAMEEIRSDQQAEMKSRQEERLQEAVDDGKITAEQKQLLLDRQTAMEEAREARRAENQKWMEDNGFNEDTLREYGISFGEGMGRGPGGGGRRGQDI